MLKNSNKSYREPTKDISPNRKIQNQQIKQKTKTTNLVQPKKPTSPVLINKSINRQIKTVTPDKKQFTKTLNLNQRNKISTQQQLVNTSNQNLNPKESNSKSKTPIRSPNKAKNTSNIPNEKNFKKSILKTQTFSPIKSSKQIKTANCSHQLSFSPQKNKQASLYYDNQNKSRHLLSFLGEKQVAHIQRQKKAVFQLQARKKFKVENKVSHFFNNKFPKAPLYQRSKDIIKQRQEILEEKRYLKQRLRLQKERQQQENQLKNCKKIDQKKAFALTDRLYQDYFNIANKLNMMKIQRSIQQSKNYKNKPQINEVSAQIFELMSERNQWEEHLLGRFTQYQQQRGQKKEQQQKKYFDKNHPFTPSISQKSRSLSIIRSQGCEHNHSCSYSRQNQPQTIRLNTQNRQYHVFQKQT